MKAPSLLMVCGVLVFWPGIVAAQQPPAPATPPVQGGYQFSATTDIILIDLEARDKQGNFVRDLKPSDLTLYEDGKPQRLSSLDLEDLDSKAADTASPAAGARAASGEDYQGRRLLVFYFDLTVGPNLHALDSAGDYIRNRMQPADLIALAVFERRLYIKPYFTADKARLLDEIDSLRDLAGDRIPNDPNLSMEALGDVCNQLKPIQQRKTMVWFTAGISNCTPREWWACLQYPMIIRDAMKSNIVFYADTPPGVRSGGPLNEIVEDTGGKSGWEAAKAKLPLLQMIQQDTASYYLLSYESHYQIKDGKFHQVEIRANRPGLVLTYRQGYGSEKDFAHLSGGERHQQLQDQLAISNPERSFPLRINGGIVRSVDGFHLTLTLRVPANQVTAGVAGALDFAGVVLDAEGDAVANFDDKVRLAQAPRLGADIFWRFECDVPQRGIYQARLAARDDQTGKMASARSAVSIR